MGITANPAGMQSVIAKPFLFVLAVLRLVAFGVFLCSMALTTHISMFLLSHLGSQKIRWKLGCWYVSKFLHGTGIIFGLRIRVEGTPPKGGVLVVSNHRSYLDSSTLGALVMAYHLAKAEMSEWPVIGASSKAAGLPFVKREDNRSRTRAAEAVLERLAFGLGVVNFPEGTTTGELEPRPFKAGLFYRLAGKDARIAPVRIDYEDPQAHWIGDDEFLPHLWIVANRLYTIVHVRFAQEINAKDFADGEALRDACYNAIRYRDAAA